MRIWRRKRKTRIGSRLGILLLALSAGFPVVAAESFAIIAGTVYRPPGLALPGAKVQVIPRTKSSGGQKLKAVSAGTDSRGEFSFRVPPVPAEWDVLVEYKGFQSQTKSVSVEGEQRFDLSLRLEPDGQSKGDR